MDFTVYEDNRADKPRTVTVEELADAVEGSDRYAGTPLDRQANLLLAEMGSFDPRSDEYRAFIDEVVDEILNRRYA